MNFFRRLQFARDPSITVANLVDELMRRRGSCITSVSEHGEFHLSELQEAVQSIDGFLRYPIGLKPGQLVAVYRTNNRRCFHWFLAIIRAGGIAVPLNPLLSVAEVRRILTDSGADILVTDKAVFERSIGSRDALPVRVCIQDDEDAQTLDGFLRVRNAGAALPPAAIDPTATIAIFHTSGTSGFPKGAALSSNALLGARASTMLAGLFLGPKDLALIALPWSHIMAVSIALNGMIAGLRGCFLDRFDLASALDAIERLRITAVVGVPEMFARLVNSSPEPSRLASVRTWLSASDHLPMEVRVKLRQYGAFMRLPGGRHIPPVLLNGYGMVELGGLAMMGIELSFVRGSGDLCFPVPPFRIRIVDDTGKVVRRGMTGECQIRRHGLVPHYWKDKKDAENAHSSPSHALLTNDGWLRTGDLAVRNRLGMIHLAGRIKDVIKSGGYSVYVREVEEALMTHPAVERAVAFGMPHREKGEVPVAAVELHPGSNAGESELTEWCRNHLAGYKAPRRIWIVEAGGLPQNHNGKMLRRVLQERFAEQATQQPTR
ncbi:MAG TPA: class I adenylate-forming enzyme family protein [Acidobacteriaceae bacterium]|jgi:acyl-CoA synthetase (AMP-forming)/AMP-acid ligase II|nr:class I adenylate-forming enzyme family protein [Acidobacteriaceae bacterium]